MISVIIPVYNTGAFLGKCIESLLEQTYRDLQIILINDGSTDNTLSVMKEYAQRDSRIQIINRIHEGVSAARNAGIEAATGDYVSFVDSDDWLDKETYQIALSSLNENEADAFYFEWTEEYSDGSFTTKGYDGKKKVVLEGDDIIKRFFRMDLSLRLSSSLLKRSLLKDVLFEVGRERGEDMLVSFQTIAHAGKIVYMDLPLYHRYHRVGSLSNQTSFQRSDFGRATCTDVMVDYIAKNKPSLIQNAYVYSLNFYMVILNQISYYRCEKENADIYSLIQKRLKELWELIDNPRKNLPKELLYAYCVFCCNKTIYHWIMVFYYQVIKRELGGKRQR